MAERFSRLKSKLKCNQPVREKSGEKTHKVKACQNGEEKLVRFGHSMPDGTSNPERRKSFRARHNCSEKKDKLKAGYWSCKNW